jgi:HK97 family phage major capsid protein
VNAHYSNVKQNAPGSTAIVTHPRDAEILALLKDSTGQPLRLPSAIAELPILTSTQIKTDRTQGSSSDASNAYVGDFSQVIVGVRPSLQIRFRELVERFSDNLQIAFLAWGRYDVAIAHPEFLTKVIGLRIV